MATAEEIGRLVSRLPHPVIVDYGSEKLRLGARGQTNPTLIRSLIGTLPTGVQFVKN